MKYPTINMKMTGYNLKTICKDKNITIKDIQAFLSLSCVHTIYKWFRGESLPSIDHLYALQELLSVSINEMIVGSLNYSGLYIIKKLSLSIIESKSFENTNAQLNSEYFINFGNDCIYIHYMLYKSHNMIKYKYCSYLYILSMSCNCKLHDIDKSLLYNFPYK